MHDNSRWHRPRALIAAFVVAAGPSPAQVLVPACPEDDSADKLTTYVPDFGRQGQTGRYDVEVSRGVPTDISEVTITFSSGGQVLATGPVVLDGAGDATLILPAPTSGRTYTVQYGWLQGAGSQAACRGSDRFDIPLIPVDATAGRVDRMRLTGRFNVSYRPVNYEQRTTPSRWTVRPNCNLLTRQKGAAAAADGDGADGGGDACHVLGMSRDRLTPCGSYSPPSSPSGYTETASQTTPQVMPPAAKHKANSKP